MAYALTSGPASPEFASFEPVGTTDMVNLFSGDFTYNLPVVQIPGPEGSGYAMSLSYHSGVSPEEEASWVGYGWTLNPGAINRQVKGFPDDAEEYQVEQYAKAPLSWTASAAGSTSIEVIGIDKTKKTDKNGQINPDGGKLKISLNGSTSIRFNNYNGYARYYGYGIGVTGMNSLGTVGIGLNADKSPQGTTYRPVVGISRDFSKNKGSGYAVPGTNGRLKIKGFDYLGSNIGSMYTSLVTGLRVSKPAMIPAFKFPGLDGINFSFADGIKLAPYNLAAQIGINGSLNWQMDALVSNFKGQGLMSHTSEQTENLLHDYYSEQDNPFTNRLIYTSVPFANYDAYNVSGEGLGGSFRYIPAQLKAFGPNKRHVRRGTGSGGGDYNIGDGVTFGINLGYTSQSQNLSSDLWQPENDKSGQFRFMNDMGGLLQIKNPDPLVPAYQNTRDPEKNHVLPALDTSLWTRSSIIDYVKFNDAEPTGYPSDLQVASVKDFMSRKKQGSAVALMKVRTKDGNLYRYGLPVLAKSEAEISFSYKDAYAENAIVYAKTPLKRVPSSGIGNPDWMVQADSSSTDYVERIYGTVKNSPHVSTYLITEILAANYADNGNGYADGSDAGGWTQFQYHKKYGFSSDSISPLGWYRWRMPYKGLYYQKGSVADKKDDAGHVSTGMKEVYYLKTIETKTHIAFFITNQTDSSRFSAILHDNLAMIPKSYLQGSKQQRYDGLDALFPGSNSDPASERNAQAGNHSLERLEKIVVFSKDRPELPLKVVRFEYDYSLVRRLPNSAGNSAASGKLTLKKVWFEYEGTQTSLTLPYEFQYKYKKLGEFPGQLVHDYPDLMNNDAWPTCSDNAQNPDYAPLMCDAWGFNMPFSEKRQKYLNPWVYQGPLQAPDNRFTGRRDWRGESVADAELDFDPAAWQLKVIKLPTGGEIHVQYEQKDYSYVQNQAPMAMVSLLKSTESGSGTSYWIEPEDLGLNPRDPDYRERLIKQKDRINTYFTDTKLFFKFLYLLDQAHSPKANLENCMSEYISGYTSFAPTSAVIDSIGSLKTIRIDLNRGYDNAKLDHPRRAAYDYYTTRRFGLWDGAQCESLFGSTFEPFVNGTIESGFPVAQWLAAIGLFTALTDKLLNVYTYGIPKIENTGQDLNSNLSYLKLPMLAAKRGGGARVKRLLTLDYGLEDGDASLYGQEFSYTDFRKTGSGYEVISSGVATKEPGPARDESPFKVFMPMKAQSKYDLMVAGEDREQLEGPIGETLLPGATIGHSRVVVSSIHKGSTGTGHAVHEYYTCKDFPFIMSYPEYDSNGNKTNKSIPAVLASNLVKDEDINLPININNFSFDWKSQCVRQGFEFRFNNMHGQLKALRELQGDYVNLSKGRFLGQGDVPGNKVVSSVEYSYYDPGQPLPVLDAGKTVRYLSLGKETESAVEQFSNDETTMSMGLEFDISMSELAATTVSVGFSLGYSSSRLKSLSRATVYRYPAVLKSVTSTKDGVRITQSNKGYDARLGEAILTVQTDDLTAQTNGSKSLSSISIPAYWYYNALIIKGINRLKETAALITAYNNEADIVKQAGTGTPAHWDLPQNVLSAKMTSYRKNRFPGTSQYVSSLNAGEALLGNLNALWLPDSAYVYRDNVKKGSIGGGVAVAGYANSRFLMPVGGIPDTMNRLPKWINSGAILQYSAGSLPMEEVNANKISSFALYGKNEMMPSITGVNAKTDEVYFNDFELSSLFALRNTAHTGSGSLQLHDHMNEIGRVQYGPNYKRGAIIQFWANRNAIDSLKFGADVKTNLAPAAESEGWFRYEVYLPEVSTSAGQTLVLKLKALHTNIDDVKILPAKATSKAFVYDLTTYKLLAELDNLH
ncbi:MAG: hypothetical protein V4543_03660, partial [Bacteroidota bacterium]